jgi:hypothetical protein
MHRIHFRLFLTKFIQHARPRDIQCAPPQQFTYVSFSLDRWIIIQLINCHLHLTPDQSRGRLLPPNQYKHDLVTRLAMIHLHVLHIFSFLFRHLLESRSTNLFNL